MDGHEIIDQENSTASDVSEATHELAPEVPSECPVCRTSPVNPIQINCGHVFCFLCVKGAYETNGHCPMCRAEIGIDFNHREHRILGTMKLPSSTDGHYWFYEGKRGWWMYDPETCRDIEQAYQQNEPQLEKVLAGEVRIIDLRTMKQYPKDAPERTRRVCRETLALTDIRGLSGIMGEDLKRALDMMRFADDIRT